MAFSNRNFPRGFAFMIQSVLFCGCFLLLSACASSPSSSNSAPARAAQSEDFILSSGDRLRVSVFGDEDVSGEYDINGRGFITMPLVGEFRASGQSIPHIQAYIVERLSEGFLVNPRVSIEVISLRPFYILGEVRNPGSYPTFPDFDVFKAIATAGGLTPRAVKNNYILYRGNGENRREFKANDNTPVFPGDSIRVRERFF